MHACYALVCIVMMRVAMEDIHVNGYTLPKVIIIVIVIISIVMICVAIG